jgi:hypothetical protein
MGIIDMPLWIQVAITYLDRVEKIKFCHLFIIPKPGFSKLVQASKVSSLKVIFYTCRKVYITLNLYNVEKSYDKYQKRWIYANYTTG